MIRNYPLDCRVAAIHQLRVNVKSLAAEARIIRQETQRAGAAYAHMLSEHRRGKLRTEARYAQLALAFLRGRSYRTVEPRTSESPLVRRLHDKVARFYYKATQADVAVWLRA